MVPFLISLFSVYILLGYHYHLSQFLTLPKYWINSQISTLPGFLPKLQAPQIFSSVLDILMIIFSSDIPLLGWQSVSSPNLKPRHHPSLTCPPNSPSQFLSFKRKFFYLIYLAAPSLSSSTRSWVAARKLLTAPCVIKSPNQEPNPGRLLHCEYEVLEPLVTRVPPQPVSDPTWHNSLFL